MKYYLSKILTVSDSKTRLAKGIFLGALLALLIAVYTSETRYITNNTGKRREISEEKYNGYNEKGKANFFKKTDYKISIVLISLVFGTALGFLIIKERKLNKKNEILEQLESLQINLNDYLQNWRKTGSGTRGHAIGSMIESIKKKTDFFKESC